MTGLTLLLSISLTFAAPAPNRQHSFLLTDFGAVGDGVTLNTHAFEQAVAAVAAAGEGVVIVPSNGRFLTAPFNMTSHMTLHLETNATILGATNTALWPVLPALVSYGQGRDGGNGHYTSLIHGEHLTDVAIVGANGTINGQAGVPGGWWDLHKANALPFTRGRKPPKGCVRACVCVCVHVCVCVRVCGGYLCVRMCV